MISSHADMLAKLIDSRVELCGVIVHDYVALANRIH